MLNNPVVKAISSKTIQAAAESIAAASLLQGKIQALEAVLRAEKVRANGQPLPNHIDLLRGDLERFQQEYQAEHAKSVKAAALIKIEALAKDAGAKNPYLVALAMQEKIVVKVDESSDIKIQVVNESDRLPQYNPKTGAAFTAGEYIQSMKYSSEYANLFGEGRPDGYSAMPNPWKKETFNLTEQGRMMKDNPSLAAKMRSEAGIN